MRRTGNAISEEKAIDDIQGYRQQNPLLTSLWERSNSVLELLYEPPGRYYLRRQSQVH